MANFFRKFLFRFFLSCILAVLLATVLANGYFVFKGSRLIGSVEVPGMPCTVSSRGAVFLPLNLLILRDVSAQSNGSILLEAKYAALYISLRELFLNHRVVVDRVFLPEPMVRRQTAAFLREHGSALLKLISELSGNCSVSASRVGLDGNTGGRGSRMLFTVTGGDFSSSGSLIIPVSSVPVPARPLFPQSFFVKPVSWSIKGRQDGPEFIIDKFELSQRDLFCQLWGTLASGEFRCRGYAFVNPASGERTVSLEEPLSDQAPARDWLMVLFEKLRQKKEEAGDESERLVRLSSGSADMLDFDCQFLLRLPEIEIKSANFTVNGMPLAVRGSINLGEQPGFKLEAAASFVHAGVGSWTPLAVETQVEGVFNGHELDFSGRAGVHFRKDKDRKGDVEKAELGFSQVRIRGSSALHAARVAAKEVTVLLTGAKEDRSLVLRDVALLLRPAQKRLEAALLAHVCSGTAHAALRLADKTNAVNAYCLIEGVRADQAADLAGYLKGITGRMDAKLFFSSQPKGVLRGKLDMREGVLKEYQFFQWLSDLFKLDGLKRIAFEALSTDFWVDEEGAGLRDLQLRSAKADVGGFYGVRNGMASGKLTLGLSRQMMGESPKLSRLLKLVGEKTSKLDFNFQLSGAAEAPNFLWLESDFKQELEKAIPGFVERKIEKTIEDIVNSE